MLGTTRNNHPWLSTREDELFYYPHHIGDFLRDTSNLNDSQLAAYLRMIWLYYDTEKPLQLDCESIAFAVRSDEKTVQLLLRHFFTEGTDGWHHKRCDDEIRKYRETSAKRRNSANARWRNANALHEQSISNAEAQVFDANQEPITKNHINPPSPKGGKSVAVCPYDDIANAYNAILPELPSIKALTDTRRRAMKRMWSRVLSEKRLDGTVRAEDPADAMLWFKAYFERVRESDFLMGRVRKDDKYKNWQCDIDYLMTDRAFIKITEHK